MAVRDREWPGYTLWYCCQDCGRLWTYQGSDVVALDPGCSLGPAMAGDGVLGRNVRFVRGAAKPPQPKYKIRVVVKDLHGWPQ